MLMREEHAAARRWKRHFHILSRTALRINQNARLLIKLQKTRTASLAPHRASCVLYIEKHYIDAARSGCAGLGTWRRAC